MSIKFASVELIGANFTYTPVQQSIAATDSDQNKTITVHSYDLFTKTWRRTQPDNGSCGENLSEDPCPNNFDSYGANLVLSCGH